MPETNLGDLNYPKFICFMSFFDPWFSIFSFSTFSKMAAGGRRPSWISEISDFIEEESFFSSCNHVVEIKKILMLNEDLN